jgi:hypothetical protein
MLFHNSYGIKAMQNTVYDILILHKILLPIDIFQFLNDSSISIHVGSFNIISCFNRNYD